MGIVYRKIYCFVSFHFGVHSILNFDCNTANNKFRIISTAAAIIYKLAAGVEISEKLSLINGDLISASTGSHYCYQQ